MALAVRAPAAGKPMLRPWLLLASLFLFLGAVIASFGVSGWSTAVWQGQPRLEVASAAQQECPPPPECPPLPSPADKAAPSQTEAFLSQYDAGRVQRLWDHDFFLPRRSLRRGVFSLGDPARMRRFVHRLLSGEPVSVTALGGSVTGGNGAYAAREEDKPLSVAYVPRLKSFIEAVSPGVAHNIKNSALAGVTSGIYAVCAHDMVPADVDLVVLEFGINDPIIHDLRMQERLAFERLIRKVLEFKNRPAVVILNHYAYIQAGGSHNTTGDYLVNAENDLDVYGQYYGLPLLSIRAAAYNMMLANATGYKIHQPFQEDGQTLTLEPGDDFFYYDDTHPYGKTGHRALADLLVALIQETARGLEREALGPLDETDAQEPVPEPLIHGNYHRRTSTCVLLRDFERVVAEQQGFEWRNERPGADGGSAKWGWIADAPGSWAVLEVDTTTALQGSLQTNASEVVLAHLMSYERMGQARVACESGCTCEESVIDGHWERQASLTELHRFQATPHPKCRLRVTVLPDTSSPDGGHKVKLSGVIVAEGNFFQAYGGDLDIMGNFGSKKAPPERPQHAQQEQGQPGEDAAAAEEEGQQAPDEAQERQEQPVDQAQEQQEQQLNEGARQQEQQAEQEQQLNEGAQQQEQQEQQLNEGAQQQEQQAEQQEQPSTEGEQQVEQQPEQQQQPSTEGEQQVEQQAEQQVQAPQRRLQR